MTVDSTLPAPPTDYDLEAYGGTAADPKAFGVPGAEETLRLDRVPFADPIVIEGRWILPLLIPKDPRP